MDLKSNRRLFVLVVLLLLSPRGFSDNISADSLDSLIRDRALRTLAHHRTGVLYDVPIPADLPGASASVLRVRSNNLWSSGADVGPVRIPPGTTSVPPVRRLLLVRQDLQGDLSSLYRRILSDHDLVAPIVVGLLAYDATNVTSESAAELELRTTGDPITIRFPAAEGVDAGAMRCARFGATGDVRISEALSGSCLATGTGHFTIVVPSNSPGLGPGPPGFVKGGGGRWWVVGFGAVGLVLVGFFVVLGLCKLREARRMKEMWKEADGGEALGSMYVGGSRMPSAALMVRTQHLQLQMSKSPM